MISQSQVVDAVLESFKHKDLTKNATDLMLSSTKVVLDRAQQNISEQLKEDTAPIVQEFVLNLSKSLMDLSVTFLNKQVKNKENMLPVFPVGTRLVKQNGSNLTVVVEEPPQCRNLSFLSEAVGRAYSSLGWGRRKAAKEVHGYLVASYYLSLPYTVFIINFAGGSFNRLEIGHRIKPLETLDDETFYSIFPNTSTGGVCLGRDYHPNSSDVSKVCQELIARYWQGIFGSDYVENLSRFLKYNNFDLETWEEKSKVNSLAALDFKYDSNINGPVIKNSIVQVNDSNDLVPLLKQHIITAVGQIGGEVQKLLNNLDLSSENSDKVHSKELEKTIKEIIVQAYSELWKYLTKNLNEERVNQQNEINSLKEKLKKEFMDWVRESYSNSYSSRKVNY